MAPSVSSSMPKPTPLALFQNPLYLYLFDGPSSLTVQEKLIGAQNYRAWKIALEIGLSTKRKLGFVKGTIVRYATDENLAELWDTCNNIVICWIMSSVSESIARSIMFVSTASEIWQQLEKRFSLYDGSRMYKLNKDAYEITQSSSSVGEYYTKMKCVWEELDNINVLPVLSIVTLEILVFLACSLLQQEESQRLLFKSSASIESTALLSKGEDLTTRKVTGLGRLKEGLYHLINVLANKKSNAFMAIKSFIKFVATQFEKQVKIVRSNNDLEFVKGQCGPYLESLRIVHQTSCVDRHQQNGRVERKHKHILDTTRALRFHFKLPLKFWGDCITTATYLINRIPFSVLGNKTPYEFLLKRKPLYDHLRVFGCLAVLSNHSRTADKFEPKGVPCVFLGYPSHQKGYKFYYLTTHTMFVSRDAIFNETVFPYASNSMQQFIHPLPTTFPCQLNTENTYDNQDHVSFKEAVLDLEWCVDMDLELKALDDNGTWELTSLPAGKKAIGSHWI
nr:cysteine-rich RLK (receptor-like protein kinase) 8 [Tanacetum cinerariifolium]